MKNNSSSDVARAIRRTLADYLDDAPSANTLSARDAILHLRRRYRVTVSGPASDDLVAGAVIIAESGCQLIGRAGGLRTQTQTARGRRDVARRRNQNDTLKSGFRRAGIHIVERRHGTVPRSYAYAAFLTYDRLSASGPEFTMEDTMHP
ncbi:MAG: hypothetical protein R3E51_15370 [Rhizobiaceae bacterium]